MTADETLYGEDGNVQPGYIEKLRDDADSWMRNEAVKWSLARRYIRGYQYTNDTEDVLTQNMEQRPGMVRLTINMMLPIYNRLQGMLATTIPHISARPATPSIEDLLTAKTDAALMQHLWDAKKVHDEFRKANRWLITTGNAAFYTGWDGNAPYVEAFSPYDLLVEPGALEIEEAEWVMRRVYAGAPEIKRKYPDADIDRMQKAEYDGWQEDDRLVAMSADYSEFDQYEILEYFNRDGKHCIVSGQEVLFEEKWPEDWQFPIIHVRYTSVPGHFYGVGAMEMLIPQQREYNAARSAVIANTKLMGNPIWTDPINSGIQRIPNAPGSRLRYNPAAPKPQMEAPAPIPGYVIDNINRIHAEMMDTVGVHPTSMGKRVSGIESGVAIQALADQDLGQLQETMVNIYTGAVKLTEAMFKMCQRYMTKGMMVRRFGKDGQLFYRQVKNTDLSKEPNIFIEADSLFSNKINANRRFAVQLYQLGLLSPEEARRAISFFGVADREFQKIREYDIAVGVLEAVLEGAEVTILPTDPLQTIAEVFQEYVSSDYFRELDERTQEEINGVLIAVASMGNPQTAEQLAKPIYPMQPAAAPQVMGEQAPQQFVGGTAEGAETRQANQEMARLVEGFDARAQQGVSS